MVLFWCEKEEINQKVETFSKCVVIQIKTEENMNFLVVLLIVLHKVFLTFESVGKILMFDHSIESY